MKQETKHQFCDVHCHMLPAVDDGSKSMEESLSMLKIAEEEGCVAILLTPHYMPGKTVGITKVREAYEAFTAKAREMGSQIRFALGQELYYLGGTTKALSDGRCISLNQTEDVLVEFETGVSFDYVRNAVMDLRTLGKHVIIAHVERYRDLLDVQKIRFLHSMHVKIQVNAAAITGEAGFGVKLFTKKLLSEELIDFVGTDAHSAGHRAPRMQKCLKQLYDKYDSEYIDRIVFQNAYEIICPKE